MQSISGIIMVCNSKKIARLHFISADHPEISHSEQAIRAFNAGCGWVQLRMKDHSKSEIEKEALAVIRIADEQKKTVIINDFTEIVKRTGAHGVHLGKMDMPPEKARKILGNNIIIGGSSNSLDDILKLAECTVDYIGLGPFRFTTTKKNLNPVLGTEGLRKIIIELKKLKFSIPLIAIGGILPEDVPEIIEAGFHGIAVSSGIVRGGDVEGNVRKYLDKLKIKI